MMGRLFKRCIKYGLILYPFVRKYMKNRKSKKNA